MHVALDALCELTLFADLGQETQNFLAQRLQPRSFAPGEYIFRRGDPGGELYLVTSGEVELSVTKNSGEKLVLETVGARGFFGEVSLLDGEARSADAVAVVPTETLRLDRDALQVMFAKHPTAAFEVIGQVTRRLRQANAMLRHTSAPSPNETIEERATPFQRFADWLAHVSGTLPFLLLHIVWFALWVLINLRVITITNPFDPFPFGLLTMVVSLEAIFLSCVVLISQNRQAARDRIRSDSEYEANIRSALEVTHLHVKLDQFEDMVISRLDALQRAGALHRPRGPGA